MKTKTLFIIASMLVTGSINAQSLSDGGFEQSTTGPLHEIGSLNAGAWIKGDASNIIQNSFSNGAEIIQENNNNVLRLTGRHDLTTHDHNFSSAAQDIGIVPSGIYTVNFKANNQLLTLDNSNTGLRLLVKLKSYTGADINNPPPSNPQQLVDTVEMILLDSYSDYSVTFCVPPGLNKQLQYLEFVPMRSRYPDSYFDGVIKIDDVQIVDNSEPYDLAFDYRINCLTGQVQVMRTTAMNSNLKELFYIVENNPNDPDNLSGAGDVQVASKWFTPHSQGWHTIPFKLERGKNYYIKRGIWGSCMKWKGIRKYNVELQPDVFNSTFTFNVACNSSGEAILTVMGADQQGKNPRHMFSLYEHFPGTSTPAQAIEHIGFWSQASTNPYQYQKGPFSFSHPLDPNKHYYVKRGVWDACTPWQETRRYDVQGIDCPGKSLGQKMTDKKDTKGKISLFPNQEDETLYIETNIEFDSFELFLIDGKSIGTYKGTTISIEHLERGAYLVKLLKNGKTQASEQFVKS